MPTCLPACCLSSRTPLTFLIFPSWPPSQYMLPSGLCEMWAGRRGAAASEGRNAFGPCDGVSPRRVVSGRAPRSTRKKKKNNNKKDSNETTSVWLLHNRLVIHVCTVSRLVRYSVLLGSRRERVAFRSALSAHPPTTCCVQRRCGRGLPPPPA